MKKQWKYFNKIVLLTIIIATNAVTAMITYTLRPDKKNNPETIIAGSESTFTPDETAINEDHYMRAECPAYIVRLYDTMINEKSSASLPILDVVDMEDQILLEKVRNSIQQSFLGWMPKSFEYAKPDGSYVMLSTDKYLSMMNNYMFPSDNSYLSICNTIDMETGEVIYLDALVEVDEELAELILTEGVVKVDVMGEGPLMNYIYPQEVLDKHDKKSVLKALQLCSEPYTAEYFCYKPTFYLRYNRLYLLSVFSDQSEFYIELDKIEHKLKVPKW